jgi:[ribosomal protein S18]-alanine N-acetyltransferase
MKKFTQVFESNQYVNVGVSPLNTELVYLTENNRQVGSLLLVYEPNKASVFSLEVLKDHRKKGYGRKLMENAIERAKEMNCQFVELNTDIDNQAANKLYQSMGFELQGLKDGFNNYIKRL